MERMQFKTEIHAPVSRVFEIMLGRETFKQWTAIFNPAPEFNSASGFEGGWEKGSKILFVGINKEGKKEGMVGMIREFVPEGFVSIEYTGVLIDGKEITDGPEAEDWAGGFENYSYEEQAGKTIVTVDIDVNDQMKDYFRETYPKALEKLKEICEAG